MRLTRRKRLLLVRLIALALAIVLGLLLYFGQPVGELLPEARAALESDARVQVERGPSLVFRPVQAEPATGLIFYPGGRVSPEAYAPLGRAVAEASHLAVIPAMPLNLAVLNPNAAGGLMEAHPQVKTWVIGGHSLGGVAAARYAHDNPERVDGLLLIAAYPEAGVDLSGRGLPVAIIYAELDGLSTVAEVEASFASLPADSAKRKIAGGNHAQFGWYGPQSGDNPARIGRDEQARQTLDAVLELLLEAGNGI